MELPIRSSLPDVGLVAAIAVMTALAVSLILEAVIAPAVPPGQFATGRRSEAGPSAATLDLARLSRLMGLPERPGAHHGSEPGSGAVRTGLRVRLLGTLVSSSAGWSLASVFDLTRQKSSTLMVGDSLHDARVLEILRDRVIVSRDGHRELIEAEPGDLPGPSTDATMRTIAIRSLDENRYEVLRSELEQALARLDEVATQVRIVPAYRDGQPQGFKLFAIRPDSLFSKLGLLNGDVVRRINGFQMTTPANALEVYLRLRETSQIEVDLERNGSSIHKSYTIH
jgi:general secretion pathway protein C